MMYEIDGRHRKHPTLMSQYHRSHKSTRNEWNYSTSLIIKKKRGAGRTLYGNTKRAWSQMER